MHRFFVNSEDIGEKYITISPENRKHMQVLRLKPNEQIILCDGLGTDFLCTVDQLQASIIERRQNQAEPKLNCHVNLAISKGERLEWAIQKSVELGAKTITLFDSGRSIAKFDAKTLPKKLDRFSQIAQEAAKQAGRGMVPSISYAPSFGQAVIAVPNGACTLFFYEDETKTSLTAALSGKEKQQDFALFIGAEGGFTEDEVAFAKTSGLISLSLGRRILRCETAPVTALSALMFWAGEY